MINMLDDFIAAARAFIAPLEAGHSASEPERRTAISQALAALYSVAIALPHVEPSGSQPLPGSRAAPLDPDAVPREVGLYWAVDGLVKTADEQPEPTIGDLYVDLSEIRSDVLTVIGLAAEVEPIDLVWQARFDFETHWSWHALDALRALHPSR